MPKIFILIFLYSSLSVANEPITVGSAIFPLLLERKSNGGLDGIGFDISTTIMNSLGIKHKVLALPWKRIFMQLNTGKLDIAFGAYKNRERESAYLFTDKPFIVDQIVVYKHKDNREKWDGKLESLIEKKIAIIEGWSYGRFVDDKIPHLNTYTVFTELKCLELVSKKRLGYCLINLRNAKQTIKKSKATDIVLDSNIISKVGAYFIFPKNHIKLFNKFNAEMTKLVTSGEAKKIENKYFNNN